MLRTLFFGIILASTINGYAQKSVNDYKYIVIPQSFDFLEGTDKYQLNSLTKFLFNKHGFKAFIKGEDMPGDLLKNGCKGLQVAVKKNSTIFLTKLVIELSNCSSTVVFSSSEGTSREKEFKKAYHEALRDAFKDIQSLNYKYNEVNDSDDTEKVVVVSDKNEKNVESSKADEKKNLKAEDGNIPAQSEKILLYTFNSDNIVFKTQDYGYELLQKKGDNQVSLGKMYKLNRENSYLVDAKDLSGVGYFDGYGNFILERVNPATNKIIEDTLARQ